MKRRRNKTLPIMFNQLAGLQANGLTTAEMPNPTGKKKGVTKKKKKGGDKEN